MRFYTFIAPLLILSACGTAKSSDDANTQNDATDGEVSVESGSDSVADSADDTGVADTQSADTAHSAKSDVAADGETSDTSPDTVSDTTTDGDAVTIDAAHGDSPVSDSSEVASDTVSDATTDVADSASDVASDLGADTRVPSADTGVPPDTAVADTNVSDGAYNPGAPSCNGLANNCGANSNDNCCTSITVSGGAFTDTTPYTATVGTFALDKYEVTVGRFRQFVAAYSSAPANGAGANPNVTAGGTGGETTCDSGPRTGA